MDDLVLQAMRKWPNVPACYGWLGLSARGNWYMRDEATQAAGSFQQGTAVSRGSRLEHRALIQFIQRNYAADAQGRWYFQNGPQRVFVELESTPWIWRVVPGQGLSAHDGQPVTCQACFTDEAGWLYLQTDRGFGLVHTQDVLDASEMIAEAGWAVDSIARSEIAQRFGFIVSPQAQQ